MFENKLQVEKVEMVKKIIRQNNYADCEKSHQQCIELGIKVNKPALDSFSKKLFQLDNAPKNSLKPEVPQAHITNGSLVEYVDPENDASNLDSTNSNVEEMTKEDARKRESEITYELGELKIREHRLLNELSQIIKKLEQD